MAVRADILFQEFLHPLHALLVLDLGEGIFHGVDGIEIGEIQLCKVVGVRLFRTVKNVLFLGRAVEHDVFFRFGQLPEGHIRAHAHLPADVRHQRPHQALPRGDGPLVDAEGIVRHQRGQIDRANGARAAALLAGALRVEGQLFGGGGVKVRTALRADQLFPGGHQQRGR